MIQRTGPGTAVVESLERRLALTVSLDPTFGVGGVVKGYINPTPGGEIAAVALAGDGTIIAAGASGPGIDQTLLPVATSLAVRRYSSSGHPLRSFGDHGVALASFGNPVSAATAVVLQPDGKIVVAGYSGADAADVHMAVARFDADGKLDNRFGHGGFVILATATRDQALALTLQPDGKILIAGSTTDATSTGMELARLTSRGAPDTTFGSNGVVSFFPGTSASAYGVTLQPGGRIVVAGEVASHFAVVRFTPGGALDTTFATSGIYLAPVPTADVAVAVALGRAGRIIAAGNDAGTAPDHTDAKVVIVRLSASGAPDPTFASGGVFEGQLPYFDQPGPSTASAVAVTGTGKIVVAGTAGVNPDTLTSNAVVNDVDQMAALRLTSRGRLDSTFGSGGTVNRLLFPQQIDTAEANAVAVQPDGKVVLGGGTQDGEIGADPSASGFDLLRFGPRGRPDLAFADQGYAGPEPKIQTPIATTASVGPDGKIVVAGDPPFVMSRLTAAGQPDPSFGFAGHVSTAINPQNTYADGIEQVAWLADGKILAAGNSTSKLDNQSIPAVARYNADGTLDHTFADGGILVPHRLAATEGGSPRVLLRLLVTPDGGFVLAEQVVNGIPGQLILRRYNADGSLDTGFGSHGIAQTQASIDNIDFAQFVDDGKKLLLGGASPSSGGSQLSLAQYTLVAKLDKTFGTSGTETFEIGFNPTRMGVDTEGRIVLAGLKFVNGVSQLAVARCLPNGSLDPSFGDGGTFVEPSPIAGLDQVDLVVRADGSVVVLGEGSPQGRFLNFLAGFTPAGPPDPAFGTNGSTAFDSSDLVYQTLTADGDNAFLVSGASNAVLRLVVT